MPNRALDQNTPGLPQTDVAGLSERITALKERIVVMVHEGMQTRDQSELLFSLIRALKAARASGAPAPQHLRRDGVMHGSGLAMTDACRRYDGSIADSASAATCPHGGHGGHGGHDGR